MRFLYPIMIVLAFLNPQVWAQDFKVQATVDRNEMYEGDTFTLTIRVSSSNSVSAQEPSLPNLDDFDLLNTWRGSSTHSTFENGSFKTVREESFNYMLAPKRAGKIQMPPAQVVVNGQIYKTQPIQISVLDSTNKRNVAPRPSPQPGTDPFDEMDDMFSQLLRRRKMPGFKTQPVNPKEAFFIQVEVDKAKAYVGEQVTASWYLYTRGHVTEIDTLKYPSLNGFWKEDIEVSTRLNFKQEVINGIVYKKALLASYALFPIKKGRILIDPYKAKCKVITRGNFGFMGQAYQYTKSSKEIKIDVLPIPVDGQPQNFSGAVGVFDVQAKVDLEDLNQVKSNEPITYKIKFQGTGNAKLIDLPSFDLPPGLELYDTKKESKFFKTGKSFKEFELLIIPREQGQVEVPEFSVSLFNPETAQFYEKKVEGFTLNVLPGDDSQKIDSIQMAEGGNGSKSGKEVYAPSLILAWQDSPASRFDLNIWFALLFLSLGYLGWRYYVEFGYGQKQKDLGVEVKKRFRVVEEKLNQGQWREVGIDATNAVYYVFGAVSDEGGANVQIDRLLLKTPPSVRRELSEPLHKIMAKLEVLAFAPEEVVGSLKSKEELKKLTQATEKLLLRAISLGIKTELELESSKVDTEEQA